MRDLFALGAIGRLVPMRTLLENTLLTLLAEAGATADAASIQAVLDGMATLEPRADAATVLERLHGSGLRLLALSNGSRAATEALLDRAGFASRFEAVLSIEEVGLPKPRAEVYHAAASRLSLQPGDLTLVAVHPWDIQGAIAAGLETGYVSAAAAYPPYLDPPTCQADTLDGVARLLAPH